MLFLGQFILCHQTDAVIVADNVERWLLWNFIFDSKTNGYASIPLSTIPGNLLFSFSCYPDASTLDARGRAGQSIVTTSKFHDN